jgi:coenzyme Q-binding protein COQ10
MFALVADVEKYPQFLPMCKSLHVVSREIDNGKEVLTANMEVAYKFVREKYSSKVILDKPQMRILVEYLDGPFRHLENSWKFHAADDGGCDIEFYIEYEFRSRTLQMLMGAVFGKVFAQFSKIFEDRANVIYGR